MGDRVRFAINDKVLLPVFAFVGCSIAMLAAFVWYSAVQQDETAAEHSVSAATNIIQEELNRIGMVARDFSWQNDAVRHLDIAFSENWAAANLGYYVHNKHGYDVSLVIDHDGGTLYSQVDGRTSQYEADEVLRGGLDSMIERARQSPWRHPKAVTGLLLMDQSIVLVGVSAVSLEQNADIKMAEGDRVVVALAERLAPAAIGQLMNSPHLHDIELDVDTGTTLPSKMAMLPLVSPDGSLIGRLTWTPNQPGRKFVESVAPALGGGTLAILAFTWLLIWRVRSSTQAIKHSETRFRDVADASSDWIWETDACFELRFLSEQFAISTGTSTDEVLNKPVGKLLRPIGGLEKIKEFERNLKVQRHFRDLLCRHIDSSGRKKTLRVAGKPYFLRPWPVSGLSRHRDRHHRRDRGEAAHPPSRPA